MEEIINRIKRSFNNQVSVEERRPDAYQLYLPIYHEDGDMVDIFIELKNGRYILCDYAHTLQRLSYSYDIDTPNKETILNRILSENHLIENQGNICFETKPATIFSDIMHVTQAYAKIGSMRYFKREVIESLFYEELDKYIFSALQDFKPQKKVLPIESRGDLEVDYSFQPNGHPVYLFGIKDVAKARLATIGCLEFERANLNFTSIAVHDNFYNIPKKDQTRLMNACDKQYATLNDFMEGAIEYLSRQRKR